MGSRAGTAGFCREMWSGFFDYETPKTMVVKSRKLGVVYRGAQALILTYFVGWVFLTEKAYQTAEGVKEVSVISKVKGVTATNGSDLRARVWDVAEYVMPPQGTDSFVIITNVLETPMQSLGVCPEDPDTPTAPCSNDTSCRPGERDQLYNGVKTGRCSGNRGQGTCEVFAWCPVESEGRNAKYTLLAEAENFTIFIKNNIRFPKFNFSKGNLRDNMPKTYLQSCKHDARHNNYCPIFRLGDMLKRAGLTYQKFSKKGGVLGVLISWTCDLDRGADSCNPMYSFRRLDNGAGYNFRYARYHVLPGGVEARTLVKAYGIRVDIVVSGEARKFYIIPTIINLAAALTSVGVASVICDWLLLNTMRRRNIYRMSKFEEVNEGTAPRAELSSLPSRELAGGKADALSNGFSTDDSML
ncbi:P2X purinoceptor 4-like [Lethenteron reissneri]|uniref:P2X purinoceptor 4-like n=2 Tax=Lethenteron reissneri TaxID=7753 RepID=UPI002AB7DDCC|nr:P2X purinoceptor 4-like [Lethenteron reissneri]